VCELIIGITSVIRIHIKTAVSLPDELFAKVEHEAKRRGVSRSRLFTLALEKYLQESDYGDITNRLNEIYDTELSSLDSEIVETQHRSVDNESW
jgi:metal-responsive CopG/Arc/MetJ family transcriptional regulator